MEPRQKKILIGVIAVIVLVAIGVGVYFAVKGRGSGQSVKAECNLVDAKRSGVKGSIMLEQQGDKLLVTGKLSGISPAGKHGIHVHQEGLITNDCLDAGPHFNPNKKDHGGPTDEIRHVGDWGNFDSMGSDVQLSLTDNVAKLTGDQSIIGKAIVIHAGEDDLGKYAGSNATLAAESKKTGNAGARLACCVINQL